MAANNLGNIYRDRRELARAESLYRRRAATTDALYVVYENLAVTLFQHGKVTEAESVSTSMAKRFPNAPFAALEGEVYLYHRGQVDSLRQLLQRHRTSRDLQTRAGVLYDHGALDQLHGRLGSSLQLRLEARAANSARGIPVGALGPALNSIYHDIWFREERARGVGRLDAALTGTRLRSLPPSRRPYFFVATLCALGSRPDKARTVLAEYDAETRDTTIRRSDLPQFQAVSAEIALAERRYADAIREMRASQTLPDGPVHACVVCDAAAMGRVFDQAEMPDSAIAQFEQFTSGFQMNRWYIDANNLPGILKRLGELYEARGERAKAYASYAKFVDLWKDADPDLQPRVQEVRRRMARLSDVERSR